MLAAPASTSESGAAPSQPCPRRLTLEGLGDGEALERLPNYEVAQPLHLQWAHGQQRGSGFWLSVELR